MYVMTPLTVLKLSAQARALTTRKKHTEVLNLYDAKGSLLVVIVYHLKNFPSLVWAKEYLYKVNTKPNVIYRFLQYRVTTFN